jgi:hypothetical protein
MVVAALRAVWECILHPASRAAVEAAERYADDPDPAILSAVAADAHLAYEFFWDYSFEYFDRPYAYLVAVVAAQATQHPPQHPPLADIYEPMYSWGDPVCRLQRALIPDRSEADALALHVRLIRDIFGNPFRPVSFSPEWRTDTVLALARQMYESRDFSAMPILADALQDTGCDNETVLAHCRDPNQVHARGCWVVDLVLEKG